MQLTQFSDYSLRVLIYLAAKKDLSTVDEVAARFKVSRNHLVKVVHKLSTLGLVESFQGKKGGIRLGKNPTDLKVGEIIKQTEPHLNLVECFDDESNTCPIKNNCELERMLQEAKKAFLDTLNQYTVADFINTKAAASRKIILSIPV